MVSVERKPSTDDGRRPVGAPRRSGWGAQPLCAGRGQGREGAEGEGRAVGGEQSGGQKTGLPGMKPAVKRGRRVEGLPSGTTPA